MSETTALTVLIGITVFVLGSITALCIASLRESRARMEEIFTPIQWDEEEIGDASLLGRENTNAR